MKQGFFTVLTVVALALSVSGCTQATDSGATTVDGTVSVLYNPCVTDETVGELDLFDVTDFSRPPIWTARVEDSDEGTLELPISDAVPGYAVDDRTGGNLRADHLYRADAKSTSGVSWEGPTFRPDQLRDGEVRDASGSYEEAAGWIRAAHRCEAPFFRTLVIAGAVGLAVIVTVGVFVTVLIVRRRGALHR